MSDIELEGVTVAFGDVAAVDDVDLRVRDGELLVLVGPSGCGKTTLLRVIAGLDPPTDGEIYVGGRRVTDLPARKRDVSLVFQDYALFPHLSVRENVSFDLRMQGADDVEARVGEVAELLQIEPLLDRSIDELSGGQKQRVALGRAIVTEPSAFLLDEPLTSLDASLRDRTRTEIVRLQADLGVTTIHVTHDQSEALTMGDRVAVMRDGRVEQVGPPETIYRRPASRFVAEFVGSPSMNLLPGRHDADADVVGVGDDRRPVPVVPAERGDVSGEDVVVGVRPEDVEVAADRSGGTWFDASVRLNEFDGADRYLHLDASGLPELVARVPGERDVEVGDRVSVRLPPDRCHCFDAETGRRLRVEARTPPDAAQFSEGHSP